MPLRFFPIAALWAVFLLVVQPSQFCFAEQPSRLASRPNIMVILADDLGFSDLGCFGGEIETPNLDRLAYGGVRLSQFYNTGRCWPTRSTLLTGYYAQQVHFDDFPGQPKSNRQRPDWAPLISQVLKGDGYRCYHSGKWHLNGEPSQQGFDHSYRLADHGRFFSPKNHTLDGKPLPQPSAEDDYYSTVAIADHMGAFLSEHFSQSPERPFFSFVAFTAPHFPLHAKPVDIEKYENQYAEGWNKIRAERLSRQHELGLLTGATLSEVEPEVGPPYDFPAAMKKLGPGEVNRPLAWNSLNSEQRSFQIAKMRIHAAMVDRMDQEIGRLVQLLDQHDQLDNTLILFFSDNGASAEIMVRSDGHDPAARPGSAATHLCLGPGWSNAANTPFRRHKTWVHEGGTHSSFVAYWPAKIPAKSISSQVGHVVDVFPTILQAAGVETIVGETQVSRPGQSLLPYLIEPETNAPRELWWLHEGNAALRQDHWKLVRAADRAWELFQLQQDPTEQNDVSDNYPQQKAAMIDRWKILSEQFQNDAAR